MTDQPCSCSLCLALLALAASAERNYQAARAERRMHVVGQPGRQSKRRKVAATSGCGSNQSRGITHVSTIRRCPECGHTWHDE